MTEMGKAGSRREPDVAGANDAGTHRRKRVLGE
jgi:hypothetical protein